MLVNRMKEISNCVTQIGAWAYVEPEVGVYSLSAVRLHAALRNVFPGASIGNPFSNICSVQNHFLNGGREFRIEFEAPIKIGRVIQRFQLACEEPTSRASHRGLFVTIRRLD